MLILVVSIFSLTAETWKEYSSKSNSYMLLIDIEAIEAISLRNSSFLEVNISYKGGRTQLITWQRETSYLYSLIVADLKKLKGIN